MRRTTIIAVIFESIHAVWPTIIWAIEIVVWIIRVVAIVWIAWGLSDVDWAGKTDSTIETTIIHNDHASVIILLGRLTLDWPILYI